MANKYKELLKKVDSMNAEEVAAVEAEIAPDYKKVTDFEKKEEAKKRKEKKPVPVEEKKHKYPFVLHIAGRNIETDHIFENGTEYKESEITTKMLEHQYYDFGGTVDYDYLEKDNVLLPIFKQHKKG